jgi:hypothetical protein
MKSMRAQHLSTLLGLDPTVHDYLRGYFHSPGTTITATINDHNLGQADLVLALLRGPPTLHAAAEALVGRPIVRLPPVMPKPLPKLPPPPETPLADRRKVLAVAPNPRLPTTPAFHRYREVRVGRTVAQLLRRGVTRKDVREAVRNGWVRLSAEEAP